MCGRFALKALPGELAARFGLTDYIDFSPRYNNAPGADMAVTQTLRVDANASHNSKDTIPITRASTPIQFEEIQE